MAIPGEMHLFGLKQAIYDTPYKNVVADTALDGFELVEDEPLDYGIKLDYKEDIRNLFMMTPYAYRTRPEDREKILSLESLETKIDFRVFVYRKI